MKRILFITLSPLDSIYSCSFRNESLINGFLENGHSVDVITVKNKTGISREILLNRHKRCAIILLDRGIPQTNIQSIKSRSNFFVSLLKYIYHKFFIFEFIPRSYFQVKLNELKVHKYDLVISSSDPKVTHKIAEIIINNFEYKPKWIQYWGDPLADDMTCQLIYPKWFLRFFERRILFKAEKIVYTSPITVERQSIFFPNLSDKMVALPTPYLKLKNLENNASGIYTVGYHGTYNASVRNICPLIESVGILGGDWLLEIVGPKSEIKCLQPINLIVRNEVANIEKYEQSSDIIVIIMNKSGGQIPGKLYHLAGLNRDLLFIVDGEFADNIKSYIESLNRYHVCLNEVDEIVLKLNEIRNNHSTLFRTTDLSSSNVARKFLEVLS
jgi:hypothetical protein